ncbi:MAG TPA: hypothetical protein VNZ01_00135 [Solirubrobacteraceae bacterium]|jgi:hypothetical protein|nr:hypothetical protein [Solirubrobacteraceae bacterium]
MADSPQALVYEEAVRRITEQHERLESLRTRAAALLSVAALVMSFLAGQALKTTTTGLFGAEAVRPSLHGWAIVAVVAFVGACCASIWILIPKRKGWRFGFNPTLLVRDYADAGKALEPMQRELALWLSRYYRENEPKLEFRYTLLQVGAALVGLEVIAWIVDLS